MILIGWLLLLLVILQVNARRHRKHAAALRAIVDLYKPKSYGEPGFGSHSPEYWEGLDEAAELAREALGLPSYWGKA